MSNLQRKEKGGGGKWKVERGLREKMKRGLFRKTESPLNIMKNLNHLYFKICPMRRVTFFLMPLRLQRALTEVRCLRAIAERVSPFCTL